MSSIKLRQFILPASVCEYDCFYNCMIDIIPACDDEYQAIYGWFAGLDGDSTSISSTDVDLWYDQLIPIQGGGTHEPPL